MSIRGYIDIFIRKRGQIGMSEQKDSYDFVADAVRKYWEDTYPQDVVASIEMDVPDKFVKKWRT